MGLRNRKTGNWMGLSFVCPVVTSGTCLLSRKHKRCTKTRPRDNTISACSVMLCPQRYWGPWRRVDFGGTRCLHLQPLWHLGGGTTTRDVHGTNRPHTTSRMGATELLRFISFWDTATVNWRICHFVFIWGCHQSVCHWACRNETLKSFHCEQRVSHSAQTGVNNLLINSYIRV